MCRTQCMLGMVALFVGLANSLSWEYVVASNTTLEFYKGSTLMLSEDFGFGIKHLTYDAVHNRLLFLDQEFTRKFFLHSLNLANMERQSFFIRNNEDIYHNVRTLAYDPATESVYFSDQTAIFWFSLKPGFKNSIYGNLLIELNGAVFYSIAIDSCRGYIYYTYYDDQLASTIARARLNGSDVEVVKADDSGRYDYLVIDQQTQKLYHSFEPSTFTWGSWDTSTNFFLIGSVDLNGDRNLDHELYSEHLSTRNSEFAYTVSQDFIYWTHEKSGWDVTVWKIQKNGGGGVKSDKIYTNSFVGYYNSIVANYKIEDQTRGVQICEALLTKNSVSNDNSVIFSANESLVCQNYCFQGNCSVIEGQAICRCDAGYSGDRCEVNKCQGYCLNDADCYLNDDSEPVCQCKGDYGGERCDVSVFLMKCLQTVSMLKDILNTDVTPAALDYEVKSSCGTTTF